MFTLNIDLKRKIVLCQQYLHVYMKTAKLPNGLFLTVALKCIYLKPSMRVYYKQSWSSFVSVLARHGD